MAKVNALVVSALYLFALAGFSHSYQIEGKVYCDPCGVQFHTSISKFLEGVDVELLCRSQETGNVTYTVKGKSGKEGAYTLKAEGDHGNELCEVMVVGQSPLPECAELMDDTALVSLTNDGSPSDVRYANYIGFTKKEADAECDKALEELGIYSDISNHEVDEGEGPPTEQQQPANEQQQPANEQQQPANEQQQPAT